MCNSIIPRVLCGGVYEEAIAGALLQVYPHKENKCRARETSIVAFLKSQVFDFTASKSFSQYVLPIKRAK